MRQYWTGGEWQAHCCKLLSIKHGEDVQMVPDRMRGDQGMEAYRLDDGMVYQCYAVDEPLSLRDQTEAQKKKIRTDVAKLVEKADEVMKLLGRDYRIRRWVLLTPDFDDKELVKYARMKSGKVRDSNPKPQWCHDDFQIIVHEDTELFAAQLPLLYGAQSAVTIRMPFPDESELSNVDHADADRLREKLRAHPGLGNNSVRLEEVRKSLLLEYLYGKSQLVQLQGRYGSIYEKIRLRADLTLRGLGRRLIFEPNVNEDQLIGDLIRSLQQDLPELASIHCEELARYYFASWWIDCPMRYGNAS